MRLNGFKFIKLASISIGSVVILLSFQNCTKNQLEKIVPIEYSTTATALSATMCNQNLDLGATPSKYIFVVDMSGSNVGAWTVVGNQSYWDFKVATDINGDRFKAIENFLNKCGSSSGAQYAIIGFSNSNSGAGTINTDGDLNFSSGGVNFKTATNLKMDLAKMASRQVADIANLGRWDMDAVPAEALLNPSDVTSKVIMRSTSYSRAATVLTGLIQNDMNNTITPASVYHVFFLSDGIPDDGKDLSISNPYKRGLDCNKLDGTGVYNNYAKWIPKLAGKADIVDPNTNTVSQVDVDYNTTLLTDEERAQLADRMEQCYFYTAMDPMFTVRTLALTKGKNILLHGLFYGGGTTAPKVLDQLAIEGGTDGAIGLASFATDQDILCKMVSAKSYIQMKPSVAFGVSLTTSRKGDHLIVDSDLDGLSDDEETELGSDPQNPRSLVGGVLDGICLRLGGKSPCQTKRNSITCNSSLFNPMGLSECDFKMMELDRITGVTSTVFGIDTDKDGVPDFVEIVKGLDPTVNEMNDDLDHDGVTTFNELLKGTDPSYPDSNIVDQALNLFKVNSNPGLCAGNGGVQFSISQLQKQSGASCAKCATQYNHAANEQVMMYVYRLTPQNSTEKTVEYRFKSILFDSETGNASNPSNQTIDSASFTLLGNLQ